MYQIIIYSQDPKISADVKKTVLAFSRKYGRKIRIKTFCDLTLISNYVRNLCDIAVCIFPSVQPENAINRIISSGLFSAEIQFIIISSSNASIPSQYTNITLVSNTQEMISRALVECFEFIDNYGTTIKILSNRELVNIRIGDIIYLESNGHRVIINYLNHQRKVSTISCTTSLRSFEQRLQRRGFLRVHKCYLVNIDFIRKMRFNRVVLDYNITLPINAKRYRQTSMSYNTWMSKKRNN